MSRVKPVLAHQLLNRLVMLSQYSCKLIRNAHFTGETGRVYDKKAIIPLSSSRLTPVVDTHVSYQNVVTETDLKCQHLISSTLKSIYPDAKQVGEEDKMILREGIHN